MEKTNQSNNVITKAEHGKYIVSSEGHAPKEKCSIYEQLYTSKYINIVDIDKYLPDDVPHVNENNKIFVIAFLPSMNVEKPF